MKEIIRFLFVIVCAGIVLRICKRLSKNKCKHPH